MTTRTPPMPLEWHPWYRDKTWLLDWLNGDSGYPPVMKVPVMPSLRAAALHPEEPPEMVEMPRIVTLTKSKAAALAPYVGRPFRYEWTFAVDELGREIASDSRRVYVDWWRGRW